MHAPKTDRYQNQRRLRSHPMRRRSLSLNARSMTVASPSAHPRRCSRSTCEVRKNCLVWKRVPRVLFFLIIFSMASAFLGYMAGVWMAGRMVMHCFSDTPHICDMPGYLPMPVVSRFFNFWT